jgi:hypothetical protein
MSKALYFWKPSGMRLGYKGGYVSDHPPVANENGDLVKDKTKQASQKELDSGWLKFFGITWLPKDKIVKVEFDMTEPVAATYKKEFLIGEFQPLGEGAKVPAESDDDLDNLDDEPDDDDDLDD